MPLIFNTPAPYVKFDNQSYWIRIWKSSTDGSYSIGAYTGFEEAPNSAFIFQRGFASGADAEMAWRAVGVEIPSHMRKLADMLVSTKQAIER